MSKSPKKKPTQKPSGATGKPVKEDAGESVNPVKTNAAENSTPDGKDEAKERQSERETVAEDDKPEKEEAASSHEPHEHREFTVSDSPEPRAKLITTPVIVLLIAVVAVGIYAATTQSNLDETATRAASLQKDLAKAQGELSQSTALRESEAIAHKGEKDQLEEQVAALESALDSTKTAVGELKDEKKQANKELSQFKRVSAQFKRMIDAGKLEVVFRRGRMVVNLPAQVLFDSGSAELSEEGSDALKEVAKILKTVKKKRFIVGGHTDDRKIFKANYDSNWELSAARATVVTKALIKSGIKPWNLIAAGYSQYAPVASNKTDQGRQKNRRIEIILEPYLKDIELPDTRKKKS